MTQPLLEVKNLVVEFSGRRGTLRALDQVSFAIAPGEILGVVGESGAGKSLTGAAIIGLIDPPGRIAGGEIVLQGQRIDNLNQEQMRAIRGRRIGAIFQDPLTSLNPLYTIGQQLTQTILTHLPLTPAQARERAIQLLEDTGIAAAAQRLHHYPHQFSGGMRQRVVIALALAAEPRLILLDEPTSHLDMNHRLEVLELISRLNCERGVAIVMVAHDLSLAAEFFPRLIMLDAHGRIAADGSPAEVLREPTIESVYHCRVGVHPDPECGALRVFPKRTRAYTQVGPKK